jgi:four helix bundle protein
VWRKAIGLVVSCYRITAKFPKTEHYGLTSQLQRAAVSVGEYCRGERSSEHRDVPQSLEHHSGSLAELDTHLVVGHELGLLSDIALKEIQNQLEEAGRMLTGLRKSLE